MANLKISDLPDATDALPSDLLPIVDTSGVPLVTKKITVADIAPPILEETASLPPAAPAASDILLVLDPEPKQTTIADVSPTILGETTSLPAVTTVDPTDVLLLLDPAPKQITAAAFATAILTAAGGTVSVNFGGGNTSSVIINVADPLVTASTEILPFIRPATGRDLDEMEMAPVLVSAGDVVAGVGFTLIAVSLDATADGIYTVNYLRT